jgi:HAD superfamily hydrolase (TIGR01509 family)
MMPDPMKCAIFDMDGVLVDSHPIHMAAWRRFLEAHGRTVNQRDMEFVLEGRKREEMLEHFLGPVSPEQADSYGKEKDVLFREEAKSISTIAGVREMLEQLSAASVPMAVASCGGRGRVHQLLEQLNLRNYFEAVFTGNDVKDGKPDPSIFLAVAKQMNVLPSQAICFEDSVSGVTAAKSAGMKCLGIAEDGRQDALVQAGCDAVVPNFVSVSVSDLRKLF